MEDCLNCQYVGSYGLLLCCTKREHESEIKCDSCVINLLNFLNIEQDNEILHICTQGLQNFITYILPTLTRPFILLTNNSDLTVPDDVQTEYNFLIDHELLTHWYAQNCILTHPKLTRIPIGLDYHILTPRKKYIFPWGPKEARCILGERLLPTVQESQLIAIHKSSKPFYKRQIKCYANFHFMMEDKPKRIEAYNEIPRDVTFFEPERCKRIICWEHMASFAFVLSPQGNGLDCHRTWEALCLGCIPIVKTSGLDPLFKDLPVWIVNSWKDITEPNMVIKINEFKEKQFNYEILTLRYWRNAIYSRRTNN